MTQRGCKCVGHGGAPAIAAANTLSSFDAALEHGADMIEFDVRSWRGRLVVAHQPWHPGLSTVPTLDGALTHLAAPRFAGLELNADIKRPGVEAALLDVLARHGLAQRTLVSSQRRAVVERVRALDPSVRTGISVGGPLARRRQRWRDWRADVLEDLRGRRVDALMAFHGLVDATLADAVAQAGGELYAWTVDRREGIERLAALGVAGVVTNDPRLFGPVAQAEPFASAALG